jgi:hypothetical protein
MKGKYPEVIIASGYQYNEKHGVNLQIVAKTGEMSRYQLEYVAESAFARFPASNEIIENLKSASHAIVDGVSPHEKKSMDKYNMSGFAESLEIAQAACELENNINLDTDNIKEPSLKKVHPPALKVKKENKTKVRETKKHSKTTKKNQTNRT